MKYYVVEYRDKQILRVFLMQLKDADDKVENKQLAILQAIDYTRMISVDATDRPALLRYKVSKEIPDKNTVQEIFNAIGDGEAVTGTKVTSCSMFSVKELFNYIGFNPVTYEFAADSRAMRTSDDH